jgi:cellulose synthase operon protein C
MKRTHPFNLPAVAAPHSFALRHRVSVGLASLVILGMSPAAHAVDSKASKFYEDALTRFEKKDMDGAIIQLKNALQIDKNMLPVQVLLGRALLKNGDVVAAEVALQEAIRIGVNRAEVIIPLAQTFIAQGKQKLVLEQQQFAPAGLPSNVQLQLLLVKAAASSDVGDPRIAMKLVEEARAIDSKAPGVWLAEVPIRIRAGQFREALDAADRGLALAPDSSDAWYQKGSVLHVSGKLNDALAAYDRSLKADPENVEARIARAGIYIDQGRIADAGKDVAELLRLAPGEPRGSYLSALLAERDNKPDISKAALKDVTALIDPVPPEFIRYRPQLLMLNGLAHFGLNQREKAKQYLELFQKVQSNTPASKLLAQIYIGESNVDRAIEVLELYLKTQGGDGQAMTLLGTALMAKGQHVRAASLMQRALQTRDAPEFRTVLGLSLLKSGQTSNAVTELEAALKGDPKQTQAATSLISLYLRAGQPAKAVTVAESLVKQQPSNAKFFNLLGMARGDTQNIPAAKAAFEEAVRLDDAFIQPKLNLARLEIATRAYDAATLRLNAILKADEKNAEAMFEMATVAERKGQKADTQRWLEKANDQSGPREIRWGLALSGFHLSSGRASAALEAAKRMSAKAPDDLQVLMAYARAQLGTGDTIGAKSTLVSATRVADYNPQAQLEIALLQVNANNLGGAAYSLDKALSNQPDFLPAQALLADVELRQGEPAKSEKRARDIIVKHPKRAIGYSLLGDVASVRGQTPAALESYRKAHQLEPSTETLLRLFRVLSLQDGGKPATQLATDWLKTYPKNITVQKALADHYARNSNFAAAKTIYESVLVNTPDDSNTLNNLANTMLRLKDPKAVTIAEQAVAKNPGNALAIDTLGWILFQNGQIDRALQLLRDARLREPGNAEIKYHLAVALAKTGRKNEAKEELEAALKVSSRFEGASDAVKLLAELK